MNVVKKYLKEDIYLKSFKKLQQNNSETVTSEHDKEIPKERYISPEEKQKTSDGLRLT